MVRQAKNKMVVEIYYKGRKLTTINSFVSMVKLTTHLERLVEGKN